MGVGGHINREDRGADMYTTVLQGLKRELSEELPGAELCTVKFCGIINEEITPVGRTHLGLVFIVETDARLTPGEELAGLQWIHPHKLKSMKLEFWSQLATELVDCKR